MAKQTQHLGILLGTSKETADAAWGHHFTLRRGDDWRGDVQILRRHGWSPMACGRPQASRHSWLSLLETGDPDH